MAFLTRTIPEGVTAMHRLAAVVLFAVSLMLVIAALIGPIACQQRIGPPNLALRLGPYTYWVMEQPGTCLIEAIAHPVYVGVAGMAVSLVYLVYRAYAPIVRTPRPR
jgi:hypothetical protein